MGARGDRADDAGECPDIRHDRLPPGMAAVGPQLHADHSAGRSQRSLCSSSRSSGSRALLLLLLLRLSAARGVSEVRRLHLSLGPAQLEGGCGTGRNASAEWLCRRAERGVNTEV